MSTRAARASVGVRVLKNEASAVLRRVRAGQSITITDRDRPIAVLVPAGRGAATEEEIVRQLVHGGRLAWSGGKPRGCKNAPIVRGAAVAAAVVEDRR